MASVRVKVDLSYKINMGRDTYETMGIEYGLEADALEGETATQAFDRVEKFVSDRLFTEVERIKKGL
jgi:hypothetical protein